MEKNFNRYKWITLIAFAFMYNFVYLGRFSVNNMMQYIAGYINITAHQQDIVTASVFASYALGSLINGYLADRFGAKKIIVTGGVATSVLNMCISIQHDWSALLLINILNGYFQSMIWVGGINILSKWWVEGERGKGVGIANFFSGMSHTVAYIFPVMVVSLWPQFGWRGAFIVPIAVLMLFVILFAVFAKEKPENAGLEPYEGKVDRHVRRETRFRRVMDEGKMPWKYLFWKTNFIWWCFIAMLSSICRYGLINWIPQYYDNGSGDGLLSESFSNLTLPVGMAFGTLIVTWIAGTKMFNNKGLVVIAMAAISCTLVAMFPMIDDTQSILIGIFFTGFALYGINGILWVHAIDQGCRVFSGSAAGVLNAFAYFGAFLESFIFPEVLKIFNNYLSVFIVMEIMCLMMIVCGMVVSKKNTIIVPEVRE